MDLQQIIDGLRKRIYDLERNQKYGSDTTTVVGTCLGVAIPAAGAVTNPCTPRTTATFQEATIELDAAATSDVTFDFLKGGSSIGSCIVSTGDKRGTATVNVGYSGADVFQVKATTPGDGYTSFTVHLVWHTTRDWWHPPVLIFGATVPVGPFDGDIELFTSESVTTGNVILPDSDPFATLSAGTHHAHSVITAISTTGNLSAQITYTRDDFGDTQMLSATGDTSGVTVDGDVTLLGGNYQISLVVSSDSSGDNHKHVGYTLSTT